MSTTCCILSSRLILSECCEVSYISVASGVDDSPAVCQTWGGGYAILGLVKSLKFSKAVDTSGHGGEGLQVQFSGGGSPADSPAWSVSRSTVINFICDPTIDVVSTFDTSVDLNLF